MTRRILSTALTAAVVTYVAACASSSSSSTPSTTSVAGAVGAAASPMSDPTFAPPNPDPRVGLRPGTTKRLPNDTMRRVVDTRAAEASWNLRLVSNTPSPEGFNGVTNSDLAFSGNFVYQGNYNGYQVWDISNPRRPSLKTAYLCPASQSDVSVYGNLLFVSGEGGSGRTDCGTQGVQGQVDPIRLRGIRVFDVSDVTRPKYIGNVQTCRGSHTHTVVTDPKDKEHVYIYVSGSSNVRSPEELPGCVASPTDPNTSLFRINVIQVPLKAPATARIVSDGQFLVGLAPPPRRTDPPEAGRGGGAGGRGRGAAGDSGAAGRGGRAGAAGRGGGGGGRGAPTGPTQCHDITVYPEVGLGGGACGGYGLLLDLSDVKNPRRLSAVADTNMSFWHSATFSNDGSMVLFTDEWGGGSSPRCRATDRPEWGANAYFKIENRQMVFQSYWKLPAAQTSLENCVAHNGSLIPIPGREVMVQGWYQGGISIFDWTNPKQVREIAFFDRGPLDSARMYSAGSWSVYWYNGLIVSSEISRGLDVYELVPSAHLSQNEIDAAKTVRWPELNAQEQRKIVWPPSFALARAYVDQLERSRGLPPERIAAVRQQLASSERASGGQRSTALGAMSASLNADAARSSDAPKVRMLIGAVNDLVSMR